MLELYQFEACPYSRKVREKMSELEVDYLLRNVSSDKSKRERLIQVSGQDGVPTLIDSNLDLIIPADEDKIIEHIEKYYRQKKHKVLPKERLTPPSRNPSIS